MGLDLSGMDAELNALGAGPADIDAIAASEARALGSLQEVDAILSALEAGVSVPTPSPRPMEPRTSAPRAEWPQPKSGEISLGAPVQRRAVDPGGSVGTTPPAARAESGSFELPDPKLDDGPTEVELVADDKHDLEMRIIPLSLSPDSEAPGEITPVAVNPFADDEQPPLTLFQDPEEDGDPVLTVEDRDPDAEFDALFDEATHPSGIPTRNYEVDDDDLSADDLLGGLSGPSAKATAPVPAAFVEFGPGDTTDVVPAAELEALLDPFPSDEELGSSEFEIVLDAAGSAKDIVPSQSEAPGPHGIDKRPSFLGRLFGRKDEKQ